MALATGVSVIISTYNGKHLLRKTLQCISQQRLMVPCELLVIDNASTDGTKEYADKWWYNNGNPKINYQSAIQKKPGKYFAQDLGIKLSKYSYIITCDDDNWLCDNYVQNAYDVMQRDEYIGVLGGSGEAVFEGGEKPDWFDKYAKFYAAAEQGKESGDITNKKGCVYGAGMVFRKHLYEELEKSKFTPIYGSREKNNLISGSEDTEICYAFRILGYKISYSKNLLFHHFIEKKKQNKKYLWKLMKSQALCPSLGYVYRDIFIGRRMNKFQYYMDRINQVFSYNTLRHVVFFAINYKGFRILGSYYIVGLYYSFFEFKLYNKAIQDVEKWKQRKDYNKSF
jgi:glycosyltransferase involved in cell wall biosynthesis